MKHKYSVKPLSQKTKAKFIKNLMEAAVNPAYLKKVSDILKRELIAEKDTEDYNLSVASAYFDQPAAVLREVGQKSLKSGDAFKIAEQIQAFEQGREDVNFFYHNQRAVGTYEFFPFTWKVGQELRAQFILKTEKSDSFDSLMDEADGVITKFLSINDWIILKQAMKSAELRFADSKIRFLEPEVKMGEAENISNKEIGESTLDGLDRSSVIDVRNDSHDMLSLKEFITMLRGDQVHPLTIGPGFFAKYMPELKKSGVSGIIFKVTDNRLVEIKLNKFNDQAEVLEFSPVDAARALTEQYYTVFKKPLFSKNEVKDYKKSDIFGENSRYYVVVDGCVCGPEKTTPMGYEALSINDSRIAAGEVFLFEYAEDKIQNTRLYFTPYDYSKLSLIHQHGSVVFGNNDQSFNSCVEDENMFSEDSIDAFVQKVDKDDKILYEESFIAAALNFLPKGSDPGVLLEKGNKKLLLKAMGSLFEETKFTIDYILAEYSMMKTSGNQIVTELLENYAPLNKRFILGKYFEDDSGLMLDRMKTTYSIIGRQIYLDYHINLMQKMLSTPKDKK